MRGPPLFFFFKCLTEFHILHKQEKKEERCRHRSAVITAGEAKAQRWLWFKRLEDFKPVNRDGGKCFKQRKMPGKMSDQT